MDPKVLVADGEELTELYEDSKITHLTIATVWYVGVIMGGYFGEDRSISYQSDKAHFGLFWAIAHTLLCCLENDSIPSIPGFNKNDLPLAKQTALDHLEGVGADLGSVERKVFPGLPRGATATRRRPRSRMKATSKSRPRMTQARDAGRAQRSCRTCPRSGWGCRSKNRGVSCNECQKKSDFENPFREKGALKGAFAQKGLLGRGFSIRGFKSPFLKKGLQSPF